MTIIVFLVDTSASMCQRAHVNGVQKTYLDIAKGAVETFLKFRQRSQDCMGDRYMLLTFEDPPNNVKAGWKENHATFMNELKNLQSNGLTSMGEALKNAFDLLNLNRMQSGIDTYGQGRCPFYLEPSVIIVLTDGGKYAFRNGVHQEITLPLHAQMPGTKLTKEPFRWDQRLFSLVLRMPGNRVEERADGKVPHDDSMIEKMCEVTGGRSYKIKSHYVLNQCIESLVQKVQPGVVIHFDQLITNNGDGSPTDLQFQSTKRMIYVPKQHPSQKTFPVGYWPIPEPYWPDPKLTNLPPRDAHPKIKIISPCCEEPQILRNFPIDKYELEASPLTLQILSKKESNKVWPLIVSTGMQGEMPFGYLKPNSSLPIVHLYVLPYNYQMLLPLINDLFHKFNLNPPNDWVYKFTNYVKTIPQYYCPFLRRALATTPNVPYQLVQYILPENLDSYLCPAVANYLKQMKNTAKQDQENLCMRVLKQLKQPKPAYHQMETVKLSSGLLQKGRDIVTHPMMKDSFIKMHAEIINYDNYTIVIPTIIQTASTKNYRNPYDIPRRDLIDEIARMRENFFRLPPTGISMSTKDSGHCLPISDMGNYQEYLKNKEQPLRELEPTNVRQHMFGNPYKKDKNMVMVDEADLNDMAPMKSGAPGLHQNNHTKKNMEQGTASRLSRKRKAGPIRKDYVFKRSALDLASHSSCSVARESVHRHLELSSDDESTSGFTSNSDTEDDTEGCLVMALDGAESDPADPVGIADTGPDATEKGVKTVGPGQIDKVTEQQNVGSSEKVLPTEDSLLSEESGTHSPTTSPNKSEKVAANVTSSGSFSGSQGGTTGRVPQSLQLSNVIQPAEEVLSSAGEAKVRRSLSPSSSIGKQSNTSTVDKALKELGVVDSPPQSRKRQLEHDGQPACADATEADNVHNKKKPRLQQHPDQSEQQRKTQLADLAIDVLPDIPFDHLLLPSVTKQDGAVLAEEEADHQRCPTGRSELQEQHTEHQQAYKQSAAPVDNADAVSEEPKDPLGSTGLVNELLVQPESQGNDVVTEQPTQPAVIETAALQEADQQREHDLPAEPSIKQQEHAKQNQLGKQTPKQLEQPKQQVHVPGLLDQPEQSEPQSAPTESRLKAEDDLKQSEQTVAGPQHVPPVEPTKMTPPDHSQEQKAEQHEPPITAEQQTLSPRKPPPQQQLEIVFLQRPIPRNQPGSPWSLSNSVSSIADASNDMADVQQISSILKTCHNGGDDDRDNCRDTQCDEGAAGERVSVVSNECGKARTAVPGSMRPTQADPRQGLANGTELPPIVTNGRDGVVAQPSLNGDNGVSVFPCVDDGPVEEHMNMKTRSIVFRDIRRPGRDYTALLKHLELVQGNRPCKQKFVDMCINEARRFRRLRMIDCIQEWWEQQIGTRTVVDDPSKLYFSNDAHAAADAEVTVAFRSDGYMGMPPPRSTYMNSGINSVYGAEFSHNNNHHFAELVDEPLQSS